MSRIDPKYQEVLRAEFREKFPELFDDAACRPPFPVPEGKYICEMTRAELKEELRLRLRVYKEMRVIANWAYARYQAALTALEADDA